MVIIQNHTQSITEISGINQKMDSCFTLYTDNRCRTLVSVKKSLQTALTHFTVSNKCFINLPFHYPFLKPDKLIIELCLRIFKRKINFTILTLITLFSVLCSFSMCIQRTTSQAFFCLFLYHKKRALKPLSILLLFSPLIIRLSDIFRCYF